MANLKASDNPFPSILIEEGTEPTAPAAGHQRIYVDSTTHLPMIVDSSGTETALGGGAVAADDVSVTPFGSIAATDVQAALEEIVAETAGGAPTSGEYVTYASNGSLSQERVVTTPSSGGNIPVVVRKSSNETVNGSAALQDDDALLLALASSEVYAFELTIFYSSGTTPDIKFAFTVPASAVVTWATIGQQDNAGVAWNNSTVTGSGTSRDFAGSGAGTVRLMTIIGTVVNSTNAGNLQLQWAQNTSNGTDTIVYANSILKAWKLA